MKSITALLMITCFTTASCGLDFTELFDKINLLTEKYNVITSDRAWKLSINPGNSHALAEFIRWKFDHIKWRQEMCRTLNIFSKGLVFNSTNLRQRYLMCRGPRYTVEEIKQMGNLSNWLLSMYSSVQVCFPTPEILLTSNLTNDTIQNMSIFDAAISKYTDDVQQFLVSLTPLNITTLMASNIAFDDGDLDDSICLEGENDFRKIMEYSRDENVLTWSWVVWREKISLLRESYVKLVDLENEGARRNSYSDIGEALREELEMPNLRQVCQRLYDSVRPLYTLLHGVVRFYLRKQYGNIVPEKGAIPAQFLGLWSNNWESLADLIIPKVIDLDESMIKKNWTVQHMVRRADDFYQSLGLPPMTEKFWNRSIFEQGENKPRCHASTSDMFVKGDFRILYCAEVAKQDFYVLHHEMGHIQYYMAYEHQPALFRQANPMFPEAIGDAIMYGVLSPQHLHRLGLIDDTLLYSPKGTKEDEIVETNISQQTKLDKDMNIILVTKKIGAKNGASEKFDIPELEQKQTDYSSEAEYNENSIYVTADDILLLKQALNKLPQIPFAFFMDLYSWKYAEGGFRDMDMNEGFWKFAYEFQGITRPLERNIKYFDAGAEYNVPNNTPYIKYFLSSFLQHQLFEKLCKATVYGSRDRKGPLPYTFSIHRCDLYGSKVAGNILKDIMSRGHSQHWKQILQETTGKDRISSEALLEYYRPLHNLLAKIVRIQNIPIGWEFPKSEQRGYPPP